MRLCFIAVFSLMFAVFTVYGAKITNTTPVKSAKTDGQTILCNQYNGEDAKTHEAIKKLGEKIEAILKLLQCEPSNNLGKVKILRIFISFLFIEISNFSFGLSVQ